MAAKAGQSALAALGIGLALAAADAKAQQQEPTGPRPASACDVPVESLVLPAPLPHVVAALKQSKVLNILAIGSSSGAGRSFASRAKSYPALLEALLEKALAGIDVIIVNRPVSGEIVATASERIKTEVALSRPDLLIWQVGANDALAHIPPEDYEASLRQGVLWAKENGVDVLLVGFEANPWLNDDQEVNAIREATRRVAQTENVLYLRRFEAMQFVARTRSKVEQGDNLYPADMGFDCMAEQVAQALAANLVVRRVRPTTGEP